MKIYRLKYISIILIILFNSCLSENAYFSDLRELKDMKWDRADLQSFEFEINDTIKRYDFYLDLRLSSSYGFSNMYVFTEMNSPTKQYIDTIEIPLADPSGKWFGKVSGSLVENHVLFMTNVPFKELGKYKITFQQGMRVDPLTEISELGLTIKETKK